MLTGDWAVLHPFFPGVSAKLLRWDAFFPLPGPAQGGGGGGEDGEQGKSDRHKMLLSVWGSDFCFLNQNFKNK